MLEGKSGLSGDGILAYKAEVELHALVNNAREFANNKINFRDPASFHFLSFFQCDGQNIFSDA